MNAPIPHTDGLLLGDRDLLQQVVLLEDLSAEEIEVVRSAISSVDAETPLSRDLRLEIRAIWERHWPPRS